MYPPPGVFWGGLKRSFMTFSYVFVLLHFVNNMLSVVFVTSFLKFFYIKHHKTKICVKFIESFGVT